MTTTSLDRVQVDLPGRTVILVGTAHVSRESIEAVRSAIEETAPERVAVELDAQRLEALRDPDRWKNLDLVSVLRQGKSALLMGNLVLMSFQRRLGMATGVLPGSELAEAVKQAEAKGIPYDLVDRDVRTTLLRVWRKTGLWKRAMLLGALLESLFETETVNEAELEKLRQSDTLTVLLDEMGEALPSAKQCLIDERDLYMAEKIRRAPGKRIVAVVGAGHVPGIRRILESGAETDLAPLEVIPPSGWVSRALSWSIPVAIVGLFIWGAIAAEPEQMATAAKAWILATGSLAAIGTVVALGHPLTVLSAFIAAPFTTLHPAIGVGMVTGLVQAWVAKPRVDDLSQLGDDLMKVRGWWGNRVSRTLLVFFFSSIGASTGTFVAIHWLKNLL